MNKTERDELFAKCEMFLRKNDFAVCSSACVRGELARSMVEFIEPVLEEARTAERIRMLADIMIADMRAEERKKKDGA
jgi:hypothetical protein